MTFINTMPPKIQNYKHWYHHLDGLMSLELEINDKLRQRISKLCIS